MGVAAVAAGIAMPGAAQEQPLNVEVSKCVDLATPEERLACFEAQVEAARSAPPAPAAPAAAAAPTAENSTFPGDQPDRDEPTPPDILAKVTELRESVPNTYLITLDNGQIWRQTQPEHYPLRVGADVRIYFSRWRSYRLTNDQLNGYIQVVRVR